MLTVKKSEFKPDKYEKLVLLKISRNGNQEYQAECNCDRCNGRGKVVSHVCNGQLVYMRPDNGICYKCFGSGKMTYKFKVVSDEIVEKKQQEAQAKLQAEWDARKQAHIQAGYKPIDFKVADWFIDCNLSLGGWKYYLIEKETEKAICISLLIDWDHTEYTIWMPKKAMIR